MSKNITEELRSLKRDYLNTLGKLPEKCKSQEEYLKRQETLFNEYYSKKVELESLRYDG